MNFKEFDWIIGTLLITYHVVLLITLPLYLYFSTPSLGLLITTAILVLLCGTGISAGYHRFYAHKAYILRKVVEGVVLFFGTLSIQGSVLKWCHDHRLHHRYVDTDQDPYSVRKGFWYAHCLWILKKGKAFHPEVIQDLMKNKLVVFQDKHYFPLMLFTNGLTVLCFGRIFNDYAGAFVFTFLTRLFITHHSTFFINSLAHTWGTKPYSKESSAVNNWIISFLTFGEGYHNYHHTFASDYRNGVRWYQYDSTKVLIWTLSKLRLAKCLKKIDNFLIKKRLLLEDKRVLLEKVQKVDSSHRKELEQAIVQLADSLCTRLSNIRVLVKNYEIVKKDKIQRITLQAKIDRLKNSIQIGFKEWNQLYADVLKKTCGTHS